MSTLKATAILVGALFLSGCEKDPPAQTLPPARPAPTPQPQPQPTGGWQFAFGRPPRDLSEADGEVSFSFDNAEPHMLWRRTGPLGGSVRVSWLFEEGEVKPVQGSTATVSLIIVRSGVDWSGNPDGTPKDPNGRFYYAGQPIMSRSGSMDVPLTWEHWTNVSGQRNEVGFAAIKASAEYIGLAFGDPAAGATAHGVTGAGKFRFKFEVG